MDTTAIRALQQLITEAFRQSPDNGNGYGFALATVLVAAAACVGGIIFLSVYIIRKNNQRETRETKYRDEQDERTRKNLESIQHDREAARAKLADVITEQIRDLASDTERSIRKLTDTVESAEREHRKLREDMDGLQRRVNDVQAGSGSNQLLIQSNKNRFDHVGKRLVRLEGIHGLDPLDPGE